MARRKLFSPRTKSLIRNLAGEKGDTSTTSSEHSSAGKEGTVCVQIRGTLCVGVSKKLRTEFWLSILNQPGLYQTASHDYPTLLQQAISPAVVSSVEKDLGRTFPEIELFCTEKGKESLRNILLAYAAYDPEVGYCQGMNFLVGLLILHLPTEADAFGALVLLMQERGLRDLYTQDMPLLEVCLYQLSQLLPDSLMTHLESLGALPVLYASPWFLTCFASSFPLQIAARILDVVFCESMPHFMLKMAYTLLVANRKHLMALSSMEDVLAFITSTLPNWKRRDLHSIVSEALQTPWTRAQCVILENTAKIETVYDSVTRVEDALTSAETLSESDEDMSRSKRPLMRRSMSPPFNSFHIPMQSFMRRFR